MKIYYKDRHIKTVNRRFYPVRGELVDLILYEEYKRVHEDEDEAFEQALLNFHFARFIEKIKDVQPLVYEYISKLKPLDLIKVNGPRFMIQLEDKASCWVERSEFPGVFVQDLTSKVFIEQMEMEL